MATHRNLTRRGFLEGPEQKTGEKDGKGRFKERTP